MKNFAALSPVALSNEHITRFEQYADLLLDWNQRINLTAITDRDEVFVRHFLDALTLVPLIEDAFDASSLRLIDVGSGGGLPGIALAIVRPHWQITLLDSTRKKVNVLETFIDELELENVVAVWGRAEEVADVPAHRHQYDVAVARAVAELRELVEYCLPFVRVGGIMVAPKGAGIEREVDAAANALDVLGGRLLDVVSIQVPILAEPQTAVIVEKAAPTPEKYPRRPGRPGKRPL